MKLYTHVLSPNARKVHAVAKHLGVALETEVIDLLNGKQYEPDFVAVNPNSKVPALVDGDTTLWESNAIVTYLAAKQDSPLAPGGTAMADVLKWQSWENCHLSPAVGKLIGQYIFAPMRGAEPDAEVIESALKDFNKYAAVADGVLANQKFLCGDAPTVADFGVAVWLSYEQVCKLPVGDHANLQRWWNDVQALEGGSELLAPAPS
ncbi:MAG: glutathione S-transferase family protein [Myxococcota bacterium]